MKTCTNAIGRPGKIGPAASRFPYSRPPLRDSTQVMGISKSKAKPSEGTPQGPVDRGFAADYFGASPVASALNLPQERDSPENRNQTITPPPPARSKPDISTLQGIGHFYFALTPKSHYYARDFAVRLNFDRRTPAVRSRARADRRTPDRDDGSRYRSRTGSGRAARRCIGRRPSAFPGTAAEGSAPREY